MFRLMSILVTVGILVLLWFLVARSTTSDLCRTQRGPASSLVSVPKQLEPALENC